MTRLKISVVILILLTGTGIFQNHWIEKNCNSLMELSTYAEKLYQNGSYEKSADITNQLQQKWQDFRKKASVFIRDNKLTDLDRLFVRTHYLAENENEELTSELTELYHLLELLKNSETPRITSVF